MWVYVTNFCPKFDEWNSICPFNCPRVEAISLLGFSFSREEWIIIVKAFDNDTWGSIIRGVYCRILRRGGLYTGCPNKFGIMFWSSEMNASEASIVYENYKKIVFCAIKLLFQPFFLNCKNKNGFLKQLFSILLNKLLHNIMEKCCYKKPFSFLQCKKKGWKSNFMEQNTNFCNFCKRCSLCSHSFLSFRTLFQTCWDTLYVVIFCYILVIFWFIE